MAPRGREGGNLDARRDWGFAGDYVEAMWLVLQEETPEDFVIATGAAHSVRDFVEAVFLSLDLDGEDYVEIDPKYLHPAEVDFLQGDPTKAMERLGWRPKMSFGESVRVIVEHDLELAHQEKTLRDSGHVVAPRGSASK